MLAAAEELWLQLGCCEAALLKAEMTAYAWHGSGGCGCGGGGGRGGGGGGGCCGLVEKQLEGGRLAGNLRKERLQLRRQGLERICYTEAVQMMS
jgi:hypothetical protein